MPGVSSAAPTLYQTMWVTTGARRSGTTTTSRPLASVKWPMSGCGAAGAGCGKSASKGGKRGEGANVGKRSRDDPGQAACLTQVCRVGAEVRSDGRSTTSGRAKDIRDFPTPRALVSCRRRRAAFGDGRPVAGRRLGQAAARRLAGEGGVSRSFGARQVVPGEDAGPVAELIWPCSALPMFGSSTEPDWVGSVMRPEPGRAGGGAAKLVRGHRGARARIFRTGAHVLSRCAACALERPDRPASRQSSGRWRRPPAAAGRASAAAPAASARDIRCRRRSPSQAEALRGCSGRSWCRRLVVLVGGLRVATTVAKGRSAGRMPIAASKASRGGKFVGHGH